MEPSDKGTVLTFSELTAQISTIRESLRITRQELSNSIEAVKVAERQLVYALENGLDHRDVLVAIETQNLLVKGFDETIMVLESEEQNYNDQLYSTYTTHQLALEQLSDAVPILFFPVRIETTFRDDNGKELWVRIFPDDIAVETHEQQLTEGEIDEGIAYWKRYFDATTDAEKLQAWDLASRSFSSQRAAWVILQTKPTNLNATPAPVNSNALVFPTLAPKADAWALQPTTRILPDAFVVHCFNELPGIAYTAQTLPIPDEIKLGLDPNNDTFTQVGGDITGDPASSWMVDFDAAITKGLGLKIPIAMDDWIRGFRQILVLGIKVSLTKEVSQARLERLIDSHHFTDGFALLKQGTSTNNTDTELSGYSSVDHGNNITESTERRNPLFTPVTTSSIKKDGQILCEALGIEYDTLYHIFQSGGNDIISAMSMNNALWQSSWGYYFTQMLHPLIGNETSNKLRDFFSDFVRSRGALPSIRSGTQPYGILPYSVLSRINWGTDPNAGLYGDINNVTASLSEHWTAAIRSLDIVPEGGSAEQQFSNVLSQSAVSVDYVRRVGLGPGTVWNMLNYTDDSTQASMAQWFSDQNSNMAALEANLGIDLGSMPRIAQINFLDQHSSLNMPLVANGIHGSLPLPAMANGLNYLQWIGQATFYDLRDENLPEAPSQSLLYQTARQSMLLEYYEAACDLLGLSQADRVDPELINFDLNTTRGSSESDIMLFAGPSRWQLLDQPYEGYASIATYLDSGPQIAATARLFSAKDDLLSIAQHSIGELDLLTAELIDAASFRIDAWRLALVNQRLNAIRGIQEGSLNRNKGIFLGAYGWVENVRRRTNRTTVPAPTSNFIGTMEDAGSHGYVHAPSISQAVTAAVLRSGYHSRANASMAKPLSVNISSERVRGALDIMDGLRNGQQLGVLLGYEFERRIHEHYPAFELDQYIQPFREYFSLNNTIVSYGTTSVETVKARNVVNGIALIEYYQASNESISAVMTAIGVPSAPLGDQTEIKKEINWIWNLMDAISDLSTSEGMFHVVQGNQTKAGGVMDAISKGNFMPEMDVINTPRTGTYVNQKFSFHFIYIPYNNVSPTLPTGWEESSIRAQVEPSVNNWLGEILGDPANIRCKITQIALPSNIDSEITLAELGIQPLDLLYMINDELKNDDSELSIRVRSAARSVSTPNLTKEIQLIVNYDEVVDANAGVLSFNDILPILKFARKLITAARSLNTKDYIVSTEADQVDNDYDTAELLERFTSALNTLQLAYDNLETAANATPLVPANLRLYLGNLSFFGIEQTVYEFADDDLDDMANLLANANSVLNVVGKKLSQVDPIINALPNQISAPEAFVTELVTRIKIIFGEKFSILPAFKLRLQEENLLNGILATSTLLLDHNNSPFIVDEWIGSISKIKENAASYQMLAILASAINFSSFDSVRKLTPLQLPYANDGSERWMGAQITTPGSIKDGRVAYGASLPDDHSFAGYQVGIMIEEWIDALPNREETTGLVFHHNQPNAKAPQCLVLGLAPVLSGKWQWTDLVDMFVEIFGMAKTRAISYEQLSQTALGQFGPAMVMPFSSLGAAIGPSVDTLIIGN